ncbi:MAG: hypothetical protein ACFFAJ_13950 [Candidatus Hodarchaeota archaeon]
MCVPNILGKHLRVLLPIITAKSCRFFQALLACAFKPNSVALYKFSPLAFRIMHSIPYEDDSDAVILYI